jgi:hypothetical protein
MTAWFADARRVRAGNDPGNRSVAPGFRCDEFRSGEVEREGERT